MPAVVDTDEAAVARGSAVVPQQRAGRVPTGASRPAPPRPGRRPAVGARAASPRRADRRAAPAAPAGRSPGRPRSTRARRRRPGRRTSRPPGAASRAGCVPTTTRAGSAGHAAGVGHAERPGDPVADRGVVRRPAVRRERVAEQAVAEVGVRRPATRAAAAARPGGRRPARHRRCRRTGRGGPCRTTCATGRAAGAGSPLVCDASEPSVTDAGRHAGELGQQVGDRLVERQRPVDDLPGEQQAGEDLRDRADLVDPRRGRTRQLDAVGE